MIEEKPKNASKRGRKTTHIKYPKVSDKALREIIAQIPRGVTFDRVKYAFVDHIVNNNLGCLAAAGREMDVCYRTVLHWIHCSEKTTAKSRGRKAPRPERYMFGKYATTKIAIED